MQELFGSMAFRYSIYQRSNRKGIMRDGAAYPVGPKRHKPCAELVRPPLVRL